MRKPRSLASRKFQARKRLVKLLLREDNITKLLDDILEPGESLIVLFPLLSEDEIIAVGRSAVRKYFPLLVPVREYNGGPGNGKIIGFHWKPSGVKAYLLEREYAYLKKMNASTKAKMLMFQHTHEALIGRSIEALSESNA